MNLIISHSYSKPSNGFPLENKNFNKIPRPSLWSSPFGPNHFLDIIFSFCSLSSGHSSPQTCQTYSNHRAFAHTHLTTLTLRPRLLLFLAMLLHPHHHESHQAIFCFSLEVDSELEMTLCVSGNNEVGCLTILP